MLRMQAIYFDCPRCGGRGKLPRGEHLRRLRERAGMSLRDVARALGVSQTYLSDIELGRRAVTAKILTGYRL